MHRKAAADESLLPTRRGSHDVSLLVPVGTRGTRASSIAIALIWVALAVFFVLNATTLHLVPETYAVPLACTFCALAFVYFFGAKLVGSGIRSVLRELKSTDAAEDTFLALSTQHDLEELIQRQATDRLRDSTGLEESEVVEVCVHVLVTALVKALSHPRLKGGLKELLVEGLADKEVPAFMRTCCECVRYTKLPYLVAYKELGASCVI